MELNKVAVMGAGMMGTGIVHVVAMGGYTVSIRDIAADFLNKSKKKIEQKLGELVEKGKLSEQDSRSVWSRMTFTEDLKVALAEADLVIEAVPEDLGLKRNVFTELEKMAKPSAIFASNTSELSISSLASSTRRPEQVIGTHWFFPPQVMKLIEVIVTPETSRETLETTVTFCKKIGKETVICKDAQGFITSRAISALIVECLRIYEEGIASIEDIDKAMKLGFNHPMGPFQLIDMSGADVVYHSLEGLTRVFGDRFKPPKKMAELIKNGNLGQKTGKGFYYHGSK
ncbi:MAG: 3-hydroxyacyl-CoA dehydrogenase family protein [bacterium]